MVTIEETAAWHEEELPLAYKLCLWCLGCQVRRGGPGQDSAGKGGELRTMEGGGDSPRSFPATLELQMSHRCRGPMWPEAWHGALETGTGA